MDGDDTGTARHWFLSAAIVLALHGAGVAVLIHWARPVAPAEAAPPTILIDLAPLPVAPPAAPTEIPPGPKQIQAAPPPPPPEPEPEPEPERIEEPPPADVPVEVAVPLPSPKPPLREKPPEPARDPPRRPDPISEPPRPEPPRPEPAAPATTAPPAVAAPPAAVAAAPPDGVRASVPSSALPDFQDRMLAHIERHKRYPIKAQWQRQEGVAHVRFVMDRSGRVLSFRLERSSGYTLLDEEVLQLVQRAQPLPAPPDEIVGATLELVVPVQFYLR